MLVLGYSTGLYMTVLQCIGITSAYVHVGYGPQHHSDSPVPSFHLHMYRYMYMYFTLSMVASNADGMLVSPSV